MIALLLLLAPAQGYELTYKAWAEADLPVQFWLAGELEESVPHGYVVEAFDLAAAQWREASCGALDAEIVGTLEEATGFERDGVSTISFNDPRAELPGGVRADTLAWPGTELLFTTWGYNIRETLEADVVLNNDVDFATEEEAEADDCDGAYSLVAQFVHELGHAFGLDHSCFEGATCEERYQEASMYWYMYRCSTAASTLGEDDVYGALQLTGAMPSYQCEYTHDSLAIPGELTLECVLDGRHVERVTGVTWNTGEGAQVTGPSMSYTYQTQGIHTLEPCFTVDDPWCGTVERCTDRPQWVVVCPPSLEPDLEVVRITDTMVQLANLTPAELCVPPWRWSVTDSGGEEVFTSYAWAPIVDLEEAGTYTATLAFDPYIDEVPPVSQTFDVPLEGGEEGGCSTTGSAPAWALVLVALIWRRRRLE